MERGVHLMPLRKKNSKRKHGVFVENGIKFVRKRIESAFSVIKRRFPAHILAVTHQGFELKVFLFVLSYGIEKAIFQAETWVNSNFPKMCQAVSVSLLCRRHA